MHNITTILISGSYGLVGHNIVDALRSERYQLLTPRSSELNLMDRLAVDLFLKKYQPDFIIHCAGKVGGIQANISNPVKFLYENLQMGMNIIMGALESGVSYFLNMGSSCMYPTNAVNPLKESMILSGTLEPTNEGYAIAKCATTRLCAYINTQYPGMAYKTLVPCNLYGKYDKFDPHHSHMIPAIIQKIDLAMQRGETVVEIWGDGTARREFMYAEDLAQLTVMAVRNFESLPDIMNVGLGYDYTVNEYYQAVAEVLQYQGTFTHDLTKPSGMRRKLVDISKQTAFGFTPRFSLKEGIQKTYDYYKTLQTGQHHVE